MLKTTQVALVGMARHVQAKKPKIAARLMRLAQQSRPWSLAEDKIICEQLESNCQPAEIAKILQEEGYSYRPGLSIRHRIGVLREASSKYKSLEEFRNSKAQRREPELDPEWGPISDPADAKMSFSEQLVGCMASFYEGSMDPETVRTVIKSTGDDMHESLVAGGIDEDTARGHSDDAVEEAIREIDKLSSL